MENKMKMKLFGTFSLENDRAKLDEESLHSNKLTRMLAYLIINRDRIISYQELIEVFWEDGSKNPLGALKNLMYRLRVVMKVFGEDEYVCTLSGAYRWNPQIEVETDYEYFGKLVFEVRNQKNDEKKKELCKQAIASYQGDISERICGEPWIISMVTWCRSLFMDVVKELGYLYEKEEAWSDLEKLCYEALTIESLDEDFHYWIIKSLWEQNKKNLAMLQYENVSRMFFDGLGIHTTEKLQSIFKEILETTDSHITNINSLMAEMSEQESPGGVFFCDFQNFRQIYRVEARRIKRSGRGGSVLLLTLGRSGRLKRKSGSDSNLMDAMLVLERLLRELLRAGDVVARYSLTQYIILLPACTYKCGVMVAERIKNAFQKSIGKRHLEFLYELEELTNERR